jgi:hypothetical protein
VENLFEQCWLTSRGVYKLLDVHTDEKTPNAVPTCKTCGQPIVHEKSTGNWFHIDDRGHRLRHQGHPAKGPCRTPGKKRYKTAREAAKELDGYRKGGVILDGRVYYCSACRRYHITSQSVSRTGKRGRATGTLVHDPKLREYLELLGREEREREGR